MVNPITTKNGQKVITTRVEYDLKFDDFTMLFCSYLNSENYLIIEQIADLEKGFRFFSKRAFETYIRETIKYSDFSNAVSPDLDWGYCPKKLQLEAMAKIKKFLLKRYPEWN